MARDQQNRIGASFNHESLLEKALGQIATVLVRAGLDLPSAERLLKRAFISAAISAAKSGKNGRTNQSQVASMAGVSRLEVRKLLKRQQLQARNSHSSSRSRIENTLAGWSNDPEFSTRANRPRPLNYKGQGSEFFRLAKKYGRDVTSKSLRVQLIKLGLATERHGLIYQVRQPARKRRRSAASADLRFIASQLANVEFELGRRSYFTRKISIRASDGKAIKSMKRIAVDRLNTVFNSLTTLSPNREEQKRRQRAKHRLLVTSTITVESEADE